MAEVFKYPEKKNNDLFEIGLRSIMEQKGISPEEALRLAQNHNEELKEGPGKQKHIEGFEKAYQRIKAEDSRERKF